MKKNIRINEYRNSNGTFSIFINNIGLHQEMFPKIASIIKEFSNGSELFFGHYKTDGINISKKEFVLYSEEIPTYFATHGTYQKVIMRNKQTPKFLFSPQELVVCRAPNDQETYKMMSRIFHYYLETILFCPKIDWETFVNSYGRHTNNSTKDYVINGFTDFLFSYVDSGDFSITFNPSKFHPLVIREQVNCLLSQT